MTDKSCATCAHNRDVCVNLDSEYCGQEMCKRDSCEKWRGKRMSEQLKVCPYCGYIAALETMTVRKGWEADIHCGDCLASIHTITYDTEQEAIDAVVSAWNRRTEPDRENPQPLSLDRFKNFSSNELQTIQSALCWNISVVGDGDIRSDLVNEITGEILHRRKTPTGGRAS